MCSLVTLPDDIIVQIKSYVIFTPKNKDELQTAVDLWCDSDYIFCAHKSFNDFGALYLYKLQKYSKVLNLLFGFFSACICFSN